MNAECTFYSLALAVFDGTQGTVYIYLSLGRGRPQIEFAFHSNDDLKFYQLVRKMH